MIRPTLSLIASSVAVAAAFAQIPAPTKQYGRGTFETKVGSFKLLGGGEQPAEGTMEFSFRGSVLVSGLKGTVETFGNVRLEHEVKAFGKKVYFGNGRIRIRGQFRAVQWFGRDMSGSFNGWGIMRLYGEFDKNLETGKFRYEGDAPRDWGTGGMQMAFPKPDSAAALPKPKIKRTGG